MTHTELDTRAVRERFCPEAEDLRHWIERVRRSVVPVGTSALRRSSDGSVLDVMDEDAFRTVRTWLYHDVHMAGGMPQSTTSNPVVQEHLSSTVSGYYPSRGWRRLDGPEFGTQQLQRDGVRLVVTEHELVVPTTGAAELTVSLPRGQASPTFGWFGVVSSYGEPTKLESRIYLHLADIGEQSTSVLDALEGLGPVRWRAKFSTLLHASYRPDNVVIYLEEKARNTVLTTLCRSVDSRIDPTPGFSYRHGVGIASAYGPFATGESSFGVEVSHLIATRVVDAVRAGRDLRTGCLISELMEDMAKETS